MPEETGVRARDLGEGFYRVVAHYGFMETPDVPGLLRQLEATTGPPHPTQETSFYLGRETLLPTGNVPAPVLAQEALHPHGPERPAGHGVSSDSPPTGCSSWARRSSSVTPRLTGPRPLQ